MHCFRNILMIAPQAERADTALQIPIAFAQSWGADITIVDVPDSADRPDTTPRQTTRRQTTRRQTARRQTAPQRIDSNPAADVPAADVPAAEAQHTRQLSGLMAPFKRLGVNVAGRVLAGEPAPEIIRQVERNGHDLVVVPAAAQRPVRGKLVGIPIVPLMRDCACPVWVLKPTPALDGGILVAVNPGSAEDPDGALGHRLIRLAACFARAMSRPLSVLHVWHLTGEPQVRRPVVGATAGQITALWNGAYRRAAIRMQQFMDEIDLRDSRYELYLEEGHQPGKTIAEFAVRRQIETVVMGMTGRSGVAGLLAGNSAEDVLRGVPGSVVTLASGRSFPPFESEEGLLAGKRRRAPVAAPAGLVR